MCGGDDMTIPLFPNEQMDIYKLQNNGYDYYGEKNEYVFKETVSVDMQPYSPSSILREFGKILEDTYTIIFDINVDVSDTDQLIINNIKYEIVGSVETWNHGVIPHKEMLIKRLRKGE